MSFDRQTIRLTDLVFLGKYKIRYPGWESRWDEWVSRKRFRWLVERNKIERIDLDDLVELWCCGSNVPGAWLEVMCYTSTFPVRSFYNTLLV